jgi:putative 4-mercaptohistidine N1-methyltranferase
VDVNYLEAKAFCSWKGRQSGQIVRLPTEDEWTLIRDTAFPPQGVSGVRNDQPYWSIAPGNINLEHFCSPCPVDMFAFGDSGLFDVIGNVWQHTETPIAGLKGFAYHPLYDDFSVPTFDGRHHLIKGGSFISTGNESLRSARYAFRRHFMQHAGFRYIVSDTPIQSIQEQIFTEADPSICSAIHSHFGSQQLFRLDNFHHTIARIMTEVAQQQSDSQPQPESCSPQCERSVLELGCGVGRTCFELARTGLFDRVIGVDRTARLIRLASHLQLSSVGLQYCLVSDGELTSYHEVDLPSAGLCLTQPQLDSIQFYQADANNFDSARYGAVTCLMLSGVLEELTHPAQFLAGIHHRIVSGGLLLVATHFGWDEKVTAKDEWLGGRRENGESLSSEQTMRNILSAQFSLCQPPRDVFRIRRHSNREATLHTVQVTVWRRK